jgi:hypothetical protein
MNEYEIRILQRLGFPSVILEQMHFSDQAAIQAARRMSLGKQFEVWRGLECITGFARPSQQSAGPTIGNLASP